MWKIVRITIQNAVSEKKKKRQFQKSQSFQTLFSLVSCLDMQIELKSWTNYSDNLRKKKIPSLKTEDSRRLNYVDCLSSLISSPDNCSLPGEFEEDHRI